MVALRSSRHRQRGWAGIIGLLIALLIVAWLGKTVLQRMMPASKPAPAPAGTVRVPGYAAPVTIDPTGATPAPQIDVQRARDMESTVKAQAEDMSKRIDAGTQ